MRDFEDIRFYNEKEVQEALQYYIKHPMMKALLHFTFPEKSSEEIKDIVFSCKSIRDFQTKIIYHSVGKIIEKSTDGVTDSGFEKLKPGESYLFLSTHRDIILDTSLLNYTLYNHDLVMTASAIGDNLVQKTFLMALSKLNRNFLVRRKLSPREMFKSSLELSTFIRKMLLEDQRSVWMAQREGRTKDGSDYTQQGVLKMLGMAKGDLSLTEYFGKIKIVPISISYEFDPTDVLKMPEILSKRMKEKYVKAPDEDFKSIIQGILGIKGRIHINAGDIMEPALFDQIENDFDSVNEQLGEIANRVDNQIHKNYALWPSNYIAQDLLNNTELYTSKYSEKDKRRFERRLKRRVDFKNSLELNSYLLMYANPVINKEAVDGNKG
ncbi:MULTISPECIES: 1-acyl-sn-glycerol-3-phosphate acyltransferase [unclassified Zunongwangia]|uniref:1-acyl-sn-glycerol-3-phosphate acyltransferase n=1 Tax=unclassified Zunongwangia TaxID=2632541 RepID=UPI0022DD60F0|nr:MULTISPECIES: 1-acyl-sn-glycerol-3-phosphate acyltransferase [unclassified Zunongwangia]WBL22596.1 1-acyl-sn-glycerol-3-phosphate acyltransferase [Zunongwangia sp. HRR-M8]WBL25455.1 1-acyl-sn-glycerol-3-phosphate acyltransferase [Zunongwangia sp. HGR-M22]